MKITGGYRLPPPAKCPQAAHTIMLRCWTVDRRARITFPETVFNLKQGLEAQTPAASAALYDANIHGGVPTVSADGTLLCFQAAFSYSYQNHYT